MESQDSLTIQVPEQMKEGLLPYMAVTHTGTVSEFIRAALNYCLAQQDQGPLTPDICPTRDSYPAMNAEPEREK